MNVVEQEFFLRNGYLLVENVLSPHCVRDLRNVSTTILDAPAGSAPDRYQNVNQSTLLRHSQFIELIEHSPVLDRCQALFKEQTQLISLDIYRMGGERFWHRDLTFRGEQPLCIFIALFLEDLPISAGPNQYVLPGSHRGLSLPPQDKRAEPLPGEVRIDCSAGSALFMNASLWHSDANAVFLSYGYWWIKREPPNAQVPWQALCGASEQRLRLLGIKMPDNLFAYDQGFRAAE